MVLELGGFIEPVNPPFQTLLYSHKPAWQITRGDVILFELRPHRVFDVKYTKKPVPKITITAFDAWRNTTVQIKPLDPAKIMDIVRIKIWECLVVQNNVVSAYLGTDCRLTPSLQSGVDGTVLGKNSDDTEMTFRLPGDQLGHTLGPFFRLVEASGATISMSRYSLSYVQR